MRLAKLTSNYCQLALTCLAYLATAVACTSGHAPELDGLSDQVAQVGTELTINLTGTDKDGGKLTYDFRAPDLTDLNGNAEITVSPSGSGVFRWTPLAADVGEHPFDFMVSDGSHTTTVTININVVSAIGSATAPIFRQPLGSGTTIDLSHAQCVDLDVVVEDQDTPMVTIAQEKPLIDGATLTAVDGQTAKWHWCPSHAQEAVDRYTLVLSADDGDNPKTIKNYLIVLRGSTGNGGTSCPGLPPVISHTPADATTRLDLTLTATVTDDKGVKEAPLFYYSATNPGNSPNITTMTQLSMQLQSGDAKNGTYTVDVPNPVASAADGTSATIYYVIVADDNDDTTGTCDHTTQSSVYAITVTAGGTTTAGLCNTCTADSQCGTGNECVYMGSMGASYCLAACGGGCASGYSCSAGAVTSIQGASAAQCEPASGSCEAAAQACDDDSWETNDSLSDAAMNPDLAPATYSFVSCPSTTSTLHTNEDWFEIVVYDDSRVDLHLVGDGASDLDLYLYQPDNTLVASSTSLTSDEDVSACVTAGTYYVRVIGYGHTRSAYTLSYTASAESCAASCVDDASEDDDNASEARATTYPIYSSANNMICPNDDDWFSVTLYSNELLTIDLAFDQMTSSQDLDIHLYSNGTDLWPCDVTDAAQCSPAHGQGGTSNEHAEFTAPTSCDSGCDYDVVVRGWNGSSNSYRLSLGIQ